MDLEFKLGPLLIWMTMAFIALVAFKLVVLIPSSIGLLSSTPGGDLEPERVQLVGATLAAAAGYAASCLATIGAPPIRLADPDEAYEIGLDEALDDGAAVIEWPERLEGQLPADRLEVEISLGGDSDGREARLVRHGAWEGRGLEFGP